ncbi:MAG TPA: hypothetical protein DCZ43_08100, partial [candidate division Zixibacteria bacterium]|nr:hypothetical protein [candidate division Zixibacteria bacterium]
MVKHLLLTFYVIFAISATAISADKIIIKPPSIPGELRSLQNLEPGIGLAVSGGGARGLAVIGILKVLEREHIRVKFAAGVSIGSIVMGLYSCGYSPEEIEQIAYQINWTDLLSPGPTRRTLLTSQMGQVEKSL